LTDSNRPTSSSKLRTLDVVPNLGEVIKPAELIDIVGAGGLTLAARRLYNLLIANAFGPDMGVEGTVFEISMDEIRGTHDSNDRLKESILALMRTVVIARLPDGTTTNVQLLGGNNLGAPQRVRGRLRYRFDPELIPLLRESRIFGVLELRVMAAFSTKYGLALYEAVSRRVRMDRIFEDFSLNDMRELLGVPPGKLERSNNLRAKAIQPAVMEVNALAPFSVRIDERREGRSVGGFRIYWWRKGPDEYRAAMAEIERAKPGRKARIRGRAEPVVDEALLEA
jgi:hypothetical protein